MNKPNYKIKEQTIQISGQGLFSKDAVNVTLAPNSAGGIVFLLNGERIPANVDFVSNTGRNTVLSNGEESICLVEHFLAACSLMGINDVEVSTDKNELVFDDGSAMYWYKLLSNSDLKSTISKKHSLASPIMIKDGDKSIVVIPSDKFKASYCMDYDHLAIGKLFASWSEDEDPLKVLRARTFATKMENDFFGVSDRLLTLLEDKFNMELHEKSEPAYHKILDIIGDFRLIGINPLEINMHVLGYKSGHALNIEMAKKLKQVLK